MEILNHTHLLVSLNECQEHIGINLSTSVPKQRIYKYKLIEGWCVCVCVWERERERYHWYDQVIVMHEYIVQSKRDKINAYVIYT